MLNDKNKSQFSLKPDEGNRNLLTINRTKLQLVQIKASTMTFQNDNKYNLKVSNLSFFISNTQIDRDIDNVGLFQSFLLDMKYDLSAGDKRSDRCNFIKELLQLQID